MLYLLEIPYYTDCWLKYAYLWGSQSSHFLPYVTSIEPTLASQVFGLTVCFLITSADTSSDPAYVYASLSSGSPVRHPIRTKSDFTKRVHRSGLLWSGRRDALQLGDCLHPFSQQLTCSAAAQMEKPSCPVFEGAAWCQRLMGCSRGSKEWATVVSPKHESTDHDGLCLFNKPEH